VNSTSKHILSCISNEFHPISLEEMEKIRLMNRIDIKYTTNLSVLLRFIELLKGIYFVQEVEGNRVSEYDTIYLDTEDLRMYMDHQNGRRIREKIRMRHYIDNDLTFLEIKNKDNHGKTHKKRVSISSIGDYLNENASRFLTDVGHYSPENLFPRVETRFSRMTMVNRERTERLTIDTDLHFMNVDSGKEFDLEDIAIVELKQDSQAFSEARRILHELHVRPISISKYCLGTILTTPHVKRNRFKSKLIQINKLTNYKYEYSL